MWEAFKNFNINTQRIIGKIKSRSLSKEEKKILYKETYLESDAVSSLEHNTYQDFVQSKETQISINLLQINKDNCGKVIYDAINTENYYKSDFSVKLSSKSLYNVKQTEIITTKLSKQHPVNFSVENNDFIGQSSFTKGKTEISIVYNLDPKGITISHCIADNSININESSHEEKNVNIPRHLSMVEVNSKPGYNVNTAILETPLFNRFILNDSFDVNSVVNEKDKAFIKDVMINYGVVESGELGIRIREEFAKQHIIKADYEFKEGNQPLKRVTEDNFMKHRCNKPAEYGLPELVDNILNN